MMALQHYGLDPNSIETVFLSHLHGDHFGGLPFLLLYSQFVSRRQAPLTLVGPPGTKARVTQAMEVFFPGMTQIEYGFEFEVHELEVEVRATINGVAVTSYEVKHPSGAPSLALRFEVDGKVLAFSGDSEWTENLIPAGRDADLFICESYTYDKPVPNHLALRVLLDRLPEIRPKRLIISHMSPDMLDRDLGHELPDFCRKAEDGMVVEL
jgi:ribonuclease BN (tRNA processing enzyme)